MIYRILTVVFCLFFSFSVFANTYAEVDRYAKSVPDSYERNINKLVSYLVRPYKRNDELKARAIFAWIVYHIEYDDFKARKLLGDKNGRRKRFVSSGDAFETRVGVCADIADLFQKMAHKAGLKTEYITGYAGTDLTIDNYRDSPHAWNSILIGREWYFIDATWAMGGNAPIFQNIHRESDHKREVRNRRKQNKKPFNPSKVISGNWFLVKPEKMIKTHFPELENKQHLPNTISMKKIFRDNARKQRSRR